MINSVVDVPAFSEIALAPGFGSSNSPEDDEPISLRLVEIEGQQRTICLIVYPFHDVELVKRLLLKSLNLQRRFRISELELFYNGIEMPNRRPLLSLASLAEAEVVLRWRIKERISKGTALRAIRERGGTKLPPRLHHLLEEIQVALARRVNPKLTLEGTGATYLLYDTRNRSIAVFKPNDEEAFAPNNPRGYVGKMGQRGFRAGVASGQGSTREVAAFLLDAFYGGFSGVPVTAQVEMVHPHLCYDPSNPNLMRHDNDLILLADGFLRKKKKKSDPDSCLTVDLSWKSGSLQEFIHSKDSSADYDPRMFCIGDVHRVGILDIRLANMDRNDGNLLVVKTEDAEMFHTAEHLLYPQFMEQRPDYKAQALLTPEDKPAKCRLVPIDHGLTLPDCLDITDYDLAWLNWPQAQMPFLPAEREYIEALNPDKDADWLETKLGLQADSLRVMQVTTRLLKTGTKHNLNLHQIAMLMVRMSVNQPSPLERLIKLAVQQACVATYATSLVHKRALGMKYAMDLASTEASEASKWEDKTQGGRMVTWKDSSGEESPAVTATAAVDHELVEGNPEQITALQRPRSKTAGRLHLSKGTHARETRLMKMPNFTAMRESRADHHANTCGSLLWVIEDASGNVAKLDWNDKRFKRLFFESVETMLDFLVTEKYKVSTV